jgi:tetratricopeptide (TPR) repeat protein
MHKTVVHGPRDLRHPAWLVATVTAVAAVAICTWSYRSIWMHQWRTERMELAALVASKPQRVVDGRLAGFAWSPRPGPSRGGKAAIVQPPETQIAVARIDQRLADVRSPARLHAYGVGRLLLGDTNGAIEVLEEATNERAVSADLQSDLAAALLARGTEAAHAADLPRSLEAVERSLALNPRLPEALFGKALVLQQLHLRPQATDAWQRYLEADPATDWAREARDHLEQLRTADDGKPADTQVVRDTLFDKVLSTWGTAVLHHQESAARDALAEAETLNATLDTRWPDRFARDVIAAIRRAMDERGPRVLLLARGHVAFAAARARYLADDFDSSGSLFRSAGERLASGGSPLAAWAHVHVGIIEYRQNRYPAAIEAYEAGRRQVRARPYYGVLGKVDWGLGLIAALQGRSERAAVLYQQSARAFGVAGEAQNQSTLYGHLATNYDELGDPARSWVARLQALAGTARESVLLRASFEAVRSGWLRAGLVFAEAAARQATATRRSATLVDALRWQAVVVSKLGDHARARTLLDDARRLMAGHAGAAWDRLQAETDVATALSTDTVDALSGIAAASRALEYFATSAALDRMPEIYLARARLLQRSSRTVEARADLERGLDVVEQIRRHVSSGPDQATLTDVIRDLAEELITLHVGQGDVEVALAVAESTRGRDLPRSEPADVDLRQLTAAIPAHTSIIEYVVGNRQSFVWLLQHDSWRFGRIALGRAELTALVDKAIGTSFDGPQSFDLRRVLLGPFDPFIASNDALVIVADGPLHRLPFAALPGRQSRFLAVEHPVIYTASAASWIGARQASIVAPRASDRVLAAAATQFSSASHPDLPELPSAGIEAHMVAALYPDGTAVIGAEVTRELLIDAIATRDVVHFSGHALVNTLSPLRSELVVANADGEGLTAARVRDMRQVQARLIVLAACETAGGLQTQSEGPLGLARAFLAIGVPTVVASRWKLDDQAALVFFSAFHRAYRHSHDAALAIQTAQNEMLNAADPRLRRPTAWAGVSAFGSGS